MINRLSVLFFITLIVFGCRPNALNTVPNDILVLRDSIKVKYVPDSRVAKFDVNVDFSNGIYVLSGESDQPMAIEAFIGELTEYDLQNDINVLPDESADEYPYAIVNNSVANLRSKPKHSAELATQAVLGTVLKVLKITSEWYLVQTPDDYIAWVDHGGVQLRTEDGFITWQEADKVIVTEINSIVRDEQSSIISDVILGDVLEQIGEADDSWVVRFPDGRKGLIKKKEAMSYESWLSNLNPSGDLIESYARSLMGIPYLWGGTSSKGMDCSGFTKTVYFMNGLIIPRDASQQVNAGLVVDENLKFKDLNKGDLLFFGKPATDSTKQKTTHVGIWTGNDEFIHASKRVRVSSIDPASPNYDEFNKNRYLGSRRYLNHLVGNIEDMKSKIIVQK